MYFIVPLQLQGEIKGFSFVQFSDKQILQIFASPSLFELFCALLLIELSTSPLNQIIISEYCLLNLVSLL